MISFVNAKINLGLYITGILPNGYHTLESIFLPVGKENGTPHFPYSFCDILEIIPSEKPNDSFISFVNKIDCPLEKNLVIKALNAFNLKLGNEILQKKFDIILGKHIPYGAGIGGGSADAAFTLKQLNSFYNYIFSEEELAGIALSVGADCPFFIYNTPCLVTGIGEKIQKIELNLSDYNCILIKPDINILTKEAYSGIKEYTTTPNLLEKILQPIETWRGSISNDFELSLFPKYPLLKELKELLYNSGAVYASMSGSGSSIYGLFTKNFDLKNIVNELYSNSPISKVEIIPLSI